MPQVPVVPQAPVAQLPEPQPRASGLQRRQTTPRPNISSLTQSPRGLNLTNQDPDVLKLASWRVKMLQLGLKWVDANQSLKSGKSGNARKKERVPT